MGQKAKLFVLARTLEILILDPDGDMTTQIKDTPVGAFLDLVEKQLGKPLEVIDTITPDTYLLTPDIVLQEKYFEATGLHRRIVGGVLRRRGIKPVRPAKPKKEAWTSERVTLERIKYKDMVGQVITFLPYAGGDRIAGKITGLRVETKIQSTFYRIEGLEDNRTYHKAVDDPSILIDKAATLHLMKSKITDKKRKQEERALQKQREKEAKKALREQNAMTEELAIKIAAEGQLRRGKIVYFQGEDGEMIYGRVHGTRVVNGYPFYSIYDLEGNNYLRSMRLEKLVWGEPPYNIKKKFEALDIKKAKERLIKKLSKDL